MVKIAVLASGSGTNFENIVLSLRDGRASNFSVELLIVDKMSSFARMRAEKLEVPCVYINPKGFSNKQEFEEKIIKVLKEYEIELIALAGYMRIISETLLNEYGGKIINIHPAYLPEFPGKDGIGDAYRANVASTGVTVHYVDSGVDTGEIIHQERIEIDKKWKLDELENEIHKMEYKIYPLVLTEISKKLCKEKKL
ncbi:MAG: phosphoribosylglycinamide formyltransferase [Cetobacterium sp.]|uniref:phosphoribosylglycinamide formyltransferase n=1 Tax=unclassified Cetobacterium TaxID=2630983 RepID=UPI00163CF335|nr:phosphoribosylglycinamide formyltransferase [Cetobacterium sp. 2A]MBC2856034.1 phosphoribosylglycinamide formyltransferase [Cetobacterium sp. 2A]